MLSARRLLRLAALPPPWARSYAEPAAGPAAMAFTFASPTQVFYNGAAVRQVDVPTLTGSFGILAAHVPTLQVLKPGVVTVYGEDGTATKYFVSSGSVTVNADSTVQVLAEEAVTMDMLDLAVSSASPQPGGFAPRFSPCLRSFLCLQSTHRAPGLRLHPQLPPLMGIKGCSSPAGCGERKPSSREPLPRPHPCPGTDADLASPHPSSSREQLFPSRAW
uniref:ATP synthase F(1) complex subunit delta, mitochondrial n=1 Tax=Anas platyrhynchos TaxID=8839 RepID=A0A8B9SVW4_ANAPL